MSFTMDYERHPQQVRSLPEAVIRNAARSRTTSRACLWSLFLVINFKSRLALDVKMSCLL